jgi:hypothetical protein
MGTLSRSCFRLRAYSTGLNGKRGSQEFERLNIRSSVGELTFKGKFQMRGITTFTVAAALVLIGIGTWSITTQHAHVRSAVMDPLGMITSETVPSVEYVDYSVVFD